MLARTDTALNLIIPAIFLFGLLALGIVLAIGAFRNDRKRRKQAAAATDKLINFQDYFKRSEDRAAAHIARTETYYDRVEQSLNDISEKIGRLESRRKSALGEFGGEEDGPPKT